MEGGRNREGTGSNYYAISTTVGGESVLASRDVVHKALPAAGGARPDAPTSRVAAASAGGPHAGGPLDHRQWQDPRAKTKIDVSSSVGSNVGLALSTLPGQ
jgi:hypothetical protein